RSDLSFYLPRYVEGSITINRDSSGHCFLLRRLVDIVRGSTRRSFEKSGKDQTCSVGTELGCKGQGAVRTEEGNYLNCLAGRRQQRSRSRREATRYEKRQASEINRANAVNCQQTVAGTSQESSVDHMSCRRVQLSHENPLITSGCWLRSTRCKRKAGGACAS